MVVADNAGAAVCVERDTLGQEEGRGKEDGGIGGVGETIAFVWLWGGGCGCDGMFGRIGLFVFFPAIPPHV